MAGKLPKVTEYIKNLGKSVGYAAIDIVKEPTANISDFIETNEDLFKTVYSATKNYKQTLKVVDRKIKNSKLYEAADYGFKALKEDLRTGQFYNRERERAAGMSSLFGDDFADFSDFDMDWDSGYSNDEDDHMVSEADKALPIEVQAMGKTASGLSSVITANSKAQSQVILASAEAINQSNRASYRLMIAQNEKINGSIVAGFSGVNAGISMVNSILSGPLTSFMNESTKFYGDVSNKLTETNAYLKEMTEMQRNLYKVQEQQYKYTAYEEIVGSSGMPDLTNYAKKIYKNIMDLDPTGGMFSSGEDNNMLKMFVANPLKALPLMLSKVLIPTTVSKAMEAFDKNMSGLFSSFISRMNEWADEDGGGMFNLKGIIGSILGIKVDNKTKLDTSKYNRGPIPFDGETKKAIVDVIPAYLARIESAVSGMPERVYDGKAGKFKTIGEVRKEYNKIRKNAIHSSTYGMEEDFEEWVRKNIQNDESLTTDARRNAKYNRLRGQFERMAEQIFEDGGSFKPYSGYGNNKGTKKYQGDPKDKYHFTDEEWLDFMNVFAKDPSKRSKLWGLAADTIEAKQTMKRTYEGYEGQFMNPYLRLFDGTDLSKATGTTTNKLLKDILAEVRYIRTYGVKGRGGKGKDKLPPSKSFDAFLDKNPDLWEESDVEEVEEEKTLTWYAADKARQEAEKEKTMAERYGLTMKNLKEMDAAKTFFDKVKAVRKSVDNLLKAPAQTIFKVIDTADRRFFETMFGTEEGKEFKDKDGFKYKGFLDYLVGRTSKIFDDLAHKLKKTFNSLWDRFKQSTAGKWITQKGKDFAKATGNKLKDKYGKAKARGKLAVDRTYGELIRRMKRGEVLSAEEIELIQQAEAAGYNEDDNNDVYMGMQNVINTFGSSQNDSYYDIYDAQSKARGGIVTKYGLTMLSPGEMVIPNPSKATQMKNLAGEKREKSRIMQVLKNGKISHNAQGTDAKNEKKKEDGKVMSAIKKIMKEVSGEGADIAADALIGSGVSLITGMVGGPLLGAAAGAAIGLTKHSETVRKFMLGENDEGGVIPKKVIDFFKEHSEGMIDFGVAGGIAGLFTPLGLVGGALAGATLGYVKDTKWFKDTMFGNEKDGKTGLMSKETREKIKKAFPAIGIGAGVGVLTGPFGLIGNAVLGSAAGYIATSNEFKEMILGTEGADGKREGGLVGSLKAGLVEPLKNIVLGKEGKDGKREGGIMGEVRSFIMDDILGNTKKVFEAAGQFVRNEFLSIGDRIQDAISGVFAKHVGMPLEEFLREKVFKRMTGLVGGLLKGAFGATKLIVGSPFKAAGYLADSVMMAQMGRGTLDTKTAQERLDLRNRNKVRAKKMRLTGRDKTLELDQSLASMTQSELETFNSNVKTFMKNRGSKNLEYHNILNSTGSSISDYLTANNLWDDNKGYNLKKRILNSLQDGNLTPERIEKIRRKHKLSQAQMNDILALIDQDKISGARQAMIDESGLDEESIKKLQQATGYTNLGEAGNRYIKQMLRLGETELRSRKKGKGTVSQEAQMKEIEEKDPVARNTRKIIEVLVSINNNIVAKNKIGSVLKTDGSVDSGTDEDSKEVQDAKKEEERKDEVQNTIATKLTSLTDGFKEFFGFGKKKQGDGEEKKGLMSKVMGWITDHKSTLGKIALGIGGVSLLGYGSEFLKNTFWPAFKETNLYKKFDSVLDSVKDGTIFIKMADHIGKAFSSVVKNFVAPAVQGIITYLPKAVGSLASVIPQGIVYAVKNVGVPLVGALIKSIPSLLWGLLKGTVKGIGALFGFKSKSSGSDKIETKDYLSEAQKSMPIGNDEAKIAASFSGASNYDAGADPIVVSFDNIETGNNSQYEDSSDFDPSTINRDDSATAIRGMSNAFKRGLATGKVPTIATKIGNIGRKLISNKSIGKSVSKIATSKTLLGKAVNFTSSAMKAGGRFITETTEKAAQAGAGLKNFLTKGTAINAAKAVADNSSSSLISGIATKVMNFFEWLGGTKFATGALNFLGKSTTKLKSTQLKPLFKKLGQKLGEMIAKGGASKVVGVAGTKLVKALGNTTPLSIAFWLDSFIEGAVTKTETILGVTKDSMEITTGMRFIVGLLNAINENLLLGIIDTGNILDTLVDIFGDFLGIDQQELRAAQEATDQILEQAGLDGEEVSLAEYNNQQGLFSKLKNLFKGSKASSSNTTASSSSTSGTGRVINNVGRGRGGQQGGIYSGMKYGTNSTIGESGCAPVAAASMLGGNIPEAAKYAQMTGHVGADGSTDIGFFGDYFSAKGISNRTTTSKSDVSRALNNGQSAVLLGRDPGGGYDSAYSDSSHYITAKKGSGDKLIVNDPALGTRSMSKSKVLKNMKASVITGRGRDDNTIGSTIYNTSTSSTATANAQKIINVAKSQVGTTEGKNNDNKYGKIYGLNNQPWCCIFVWWVFRQAGASSLFYDGGKCASCTTLMNFYKQKGQAVSDIKPGDLLFFNFDKNPDKSRARHIGICVSASGNKVISIEGNTSSGEAGSQDNGGGVYQRNRKLSQIICVVRPAYNGAVFDTAIPADMYYDYETGETTDSPSGSFFNSIAELGKSMVKGVFGEDLYNAVFGSDSDDGTSVASNVDSSGNLTGSDNAEKIWTYLRSLGYSKEGTAAIMGSLYRESGLKPNNLQNTYERKLGSDTEYTNKVNSGKYSRSNFMKDSGGYGLAQWTYKTRKAGLYDATVSKGRSVDNLKDQLDYLHKEVSDMGLDSALKGATNISDANNLFISEFEKPYGYENKNSSLYKDRLSSAKDYYNLYKGTGRGYANKVNTKYSNYTGGADRSSTVTAGAGTVSYSVFLETIVSILMSIADNTATLNKILDILSENFNIKVSSDEVTNASKTASTSEQAKAAINKLMSDRSSAAETSNILQSKNTNYLVEVMSAIARE